MSSLSSSQQSLEMQLQFFGLSFSEAMRECDGGIPFQLFKKEWDQLSLKLKSKILTWSGSDSELKDSIQKSLKKYFETLF